MSVGMKVVEWVETYGLDGAQNTEKVLHQHGDKKIVFDMSRSTLPFPNMKYRNCHNWFVLDDGSLLGWNESPRNGWSLHVQGMKSIRNFCKNTGTDMRRYIPKTPTKDTPVVIDNSIDNPELLTELQQRFGRTGEEKPT